MRANYSRLKGTQYNKVLYDDTICDCKMIEGKCAKRVLLGRLAKGLSDVLLVVRVHQYG